MTCAEITDSAAECTSSPIKRFLTYTVHCIGHNYFIHFILMSISNVLQIRECLLVDVGGPSSLELCYFGLRHNLKKR